jgi:hypothetical protein
MRYVKSLSSQTLTAQVSGGLGNQLFQYYAGFFAAANSKRRFILDDFRANEGVYYLERVKNEMRILGLRGISNLNAEFLPSTPIARVLSRNKIMKLIPIYRNRVMVKDYSPFGEIGTNIKVNQLDFSRSNYHDIRIRGNLQSLEVVQEAIALGAVSSLEISEMNEMTSEFSSQIRTLKPIGVHLRLKDYLSTNRDLALGTVYYTNAVSKLKKIIPTSPIWLFTDDVEKALKILPSHFRDDISMVVDPKKFSDVETLFLMSQCEGLAIANSTFSFWAGFFQKSQVVVAPDPWFKSEFARGEDTKFNYPKAWNTVSW